MEHKVGDTVAIPGKVVESDEKGVVIETDHNDEGGAPNRFAVLHSQAQKSGEQPEGKSPAPGTAVRAKVTCESIENNTAKFRTVYEPDGSKNDENARFTKATPWGTIELGIDNPAALERFTPGKQYYVDFTPAE